MHMNMNALFKGKFFQKIFRGLNWEKNNIQVKKGIFGGQ